jgi:hypothetical protein
MFKNFASVLSSLLAGVLLMTADASAQMPRRPCDVAGEIAAQLAVLRDRGIEQDMAMDLVREVVPTEAHAAVWEQLLGYVFTQKPTPTMAQASVSMVCITSESGKGMRIDRPVDADNEARSRRVIALMDAVTPLPALTPDEEVRLERMRASLAGGGRPLQPGETAEMRRAQNETLARTSLSLHRPKPLAPRPAPSPEEREATRIRQVDAIADRLEPVFPRREGEAPEDRRERLTTLARAAMRPTWDREEAAEQAWVQQEERKAELARQAEARRVALAQQAAERAARDAEQARLAAEARAKWERENPELAAQERRAAETNRRWYVRMTGNRCQALDDYLPGIKDPEAALAAMRVRYPEAFILGTRSGPTLHYPDGVIPMVQGFQACVMSMY